MAKLERHVKVWQYLGWVSHFVEWSWISFFRSSILERQEI